MKTILISLCLFLLWACKKEKCVTCNRTCMSIIYRQETQGGAHLEEDTLFDVDPSSERFCGTGTEIENKEKENTYITKDVNFTGNGDESITSEIHCSCHCN